MFLKVLKARKRQNEIDEVNEESLHLFHKKVILTSSSTVKLMSLRGGAARV